MPAHKLNTVSKYISKKILTARPEQTLAEFKTILSKKNIQFDCWDYVYVVNSSNQLLGVFSFNSAFRLPENSLIKHLMNEQPIFVKSSHDRKRAAHIALSHNLMALPVVDKTNRLLGVLNSGSILYILHSEHHAQNLMTAGVFPHEALLDNGWLQPIWTSFIHRFPWILIGLIGGLMAAEIVDTFDSLLERNIVLAAFIPLIVYISDAVGTQTQTLYVRDVIIKPKLNIIPYALKQGLVSGLIGVFCGLSIWALVSLFWQESWLGVVIGSAAAISVVCSTFIALLIPYGLGLLKQDPADGSGPFATILQDMLSIFIYFAVASFLL